MQSLYTCTMVSALLLPRKKPELTAITTIFHLSELILILKFLNSSDFLQIRCVAMGSISGDRLVTSIHYKLNSHGYLNYITGPDLTLTMPLIMQGHSHGSYTKLHPLKKTVSLSRVLCLAITFLMLFHPPRSGKIRFNLVRSLLPISTSAGTIPVV
eukprot:g42378.t1